MTEIRVQIDRIFSAFEGATTRANKLPIARRAKTLCTRAMGYLAFGTDEFKTMSSQIHELDRWIGEHRAGEVRR